MRERFFSVAPDTETIVLHCASMVALGNERRELVMKVNVQGTQNIIDQCFARLEYKKLVYVGSTGAIQELPHGQRMKESECFVPEESFGVYGQSKAMASQLVLDAAKAGLNACIVMPRGILGPGDADCSICRRALLTWRRTFWKDRPTATESCAGISLESCRIHRASRKVAGDCYRVAICSWC